MNDTPHIIRIRELLQGYYDGSLSPEERMELADLFSCRESLPRELEMEKEIFTAIENAEEITVPEYLSDRINDAMPEQRPYKRSLKWTALYYASAAAAVMLVFTMIWNAVSLPENSIDTNYGNSAIMASYSSDSLENDKPHMIPVRPEMTDENKCDTPQTALQSAKVENRLAAASSQKKNLPRGNVRIVTDQEEADMILDRVMGIISENMFAAERACDRPDIIIESMNHTLAKSEL
ncbi:MAG: hypothetical protein K2O56_09890 [Muribaculaceae bacterium]|nr:hypothetical protein [Muribaculaceae bacterium]